MSRHTHSSTEPSVDCSSVPGPSGEDRPLCFHSRHHTADPPHPQGTGPRTPGGGGTKLCGRSSTSKNSTAFACSLRTASVYFDCLLQYLIRREHHAYRCQSIAESSFAFGDFLGFFSIFSTHGWLNLWM